MIVAAWLFTAQSDCEFVERIVVIADVVPIDPSARHCDMGAPEVPLMTVWQKLTFPAGDKTHPSGKKL